MTVYIIRRLLILPVTLLGMSLLVFIMLQLLDPAERAAMYISSPPKTPGALQAIIEKFGLEQPFHVQYVNWLGRVVQGDLGWSRTSQQPVLDAILSYFPATLELALCSVLPILLIGIWIGIRAAVNHGRWLDHAARLYSIGSISMPSFVFALVMLMIFYSGLQWFPPGRLSQWATEVVRSPEFVAYTRMHTLDAVMNWRWDVFLDAARHLFLPVITLSYLSWGVLIRVTRASMLEVLGQDYTTTARAKGLRERQVVNRHARPNALIPVATYGGLLVASLLNGAGITEVVFDYHGLGWWAVSAATSYDAIAVLGFALFNGVLLVLANLAVDVMYVFLDPRIRLT
jgi:peptide/nickel transport system permease protein